MAFKKYSCVVAGGVPAELAQLRHTVSSQLQASTALQAEVTAVAEASGLVQQGEWSSDKVNL